MSIFSRIDERTNLMGRMMSVAGPDNFAETGFALGSQLRTAFFRCQACRSVDQCKDWLSVNTEAASAPSFCPNAEFFSDHSGDDTANPL